MLWTFPRLSMPTLPATASPFLAGMLNEHALLEAAETGSGDTWLAAMERENLSDGSLDVNSEIITQSSLNGKALSFMIEMTRQARQGAIRAVIELIAETAGARRMTFARFTRTKF